jgi:hypothetical protein
MIKGPISFEKAMHGIYTRARLEADCKATIFLQMLHRHGGLGTARQLINSPAVSEGYTALYERGRLDLTVEAVIVENPRWHSLFTSDELSRVRKRLDAYGYTTGNPAGQ